MLRAAQLPCQAGQLRPVHCELYHVRRPYVGGCHSSVLHPPFCRHMGAVHFVAYFVVACVRYCQCWVCILNLLVLAHPCAFFQAAAGHAEMYLPYRQRSVALWEYSGHMQRGVLGLAWLGRCYVLAQAGAFVLVPGFLLPNFEGLLVHRSHLLQHPL
jgi:hypothetical protein